MGEVDALEKSVSLSALLESVDSGERATIAQRGRPVAQLIPVSRASINDHADLALRIGKLRAHIA